MSTHFADMITGRPPTGSAVLDPLDKSCPDYLPCRVRDSSLWFADSPADIELAKSFCQDCPARLGCLTGAVERREPWGVWGGELFDRGKIVGRKRARGRPRKLDQRPAA